jgi:hypothetical protein
MNKQFNKLMNKINEHQYVDSAKVLGSLLGLHLFAIFVYCPCYNWV